MKTYTFQVSYTNFYGKTRVQAIDDIKTLSYEGVYAEISTAYKYDFYIWQ